MRIQPFFSPAPSITGTPVIRTRFAGPSPNYDAETLDADHGIHRIRYSDIPGLEALRCHLKSKAGPSVPESNPNPIHHSGFHPTVTFDPSNPHNFTVSIPPSPRYPDNPADPPLPPQDQLPPQEKLAAQRIIRRFIRSCLDHGNLPDHCFTDNSKINISAAFMHYPPNAHAPYANEFHHDTNFTEGSPDKQCLVTSLLLSDPAQHPEAGLEALFDFDASQGIEHSTATTPTEFIAERHHHGTLFNDRFIKHRSKQHTGERDVLILRFLYNPDLAQYA